MFFYFFLKAKYLSNVACLTRMLGNLSHHVVAANRRAENGELGMEMEEGEEMMEAEE